MRPLLGIELGPSRCVLVLVDDRRATDGLLNVAGHHVVKYEDPVRLATDLRRLRAGHRLPRAARVVIWPDPGDPGVTPVDNPEGGAGFRPDVWQLRERLRPLVRAGFRVTAALAPSEAAVVLAGLGHAGPAAVLAVAPEGGALAVTSGTTTLFARELAWKFAPPERGAALLDRYVFAAQVLPCLAHAIRTARDRNAVRVDRLVLCGAAPDLRTLALPLIEELDVEVETLDGVGGVPGLDIGADEAALVQMAAAAALAPDGAGVIAGLSRPVLTPARILAGAVAAAAVILLVLLFWPARQGPAARPRTSTAPRGVMLVSLGEPCARKSVNA